jgi:hypothetical protein
MENVVQFPLPWRGKATLILPSDGLPADFKNRVYVAMQALLNVWDVEVVEETGFKNAADADISMFHIDVKDFSAPPFNWVDKVMSESDFT